MPHYILRVELTTDEYTYHTLAEDLEHIARRIREGFRSGQGWEIREE